MDRSSKSKNKSSNIVLKIGITYIIPIFLAVSGLILLSTESWKYLFQRLYIFQSDNSQNNSLAKLKYTINGKEVVRPNNTEKFAELSIDSINIKDASIYQGHFEQSLILGIGHHSGSCLPGENGMCAITGNVNSELAKIKDIKKDDDIVIQTSYGKYFYKVESINITDKEIYDYLNFFEKGEKLVMYISYPFDFIGKSKQKFVVSCKFSKVE